VQPEPTPELIEGEPEWEVETILTSHCYRCKKGLQYLVKWLRYPESDMSWEPVENIHVPRLMLAFHKEHPTAAKGIKCKNVLMKGGEAAGPKSYSNPSETSAKCQNSLVCSASITSYTLTRTAFLSLCCHHHTRQSIMKVLPHERARDNNLLRSSRALTCRRKGKSFKGKCLEWTKNLLHLSMPMRAQPQFTQNLLGSIGKKGVVILDMKWCIKARPYNAHIFDTECSMVSPSKWAPKVEDIVSLCGKYMRACSGQLQLLMSRTMTLKSSPTTFPSTLLLNRP
jgi:hypothetical protein